MAASDGSELLILVRPGSERVSFVPTVSEAAFANPLKGFRMDIGETDRNAYCGVTRSYLPWNALENAATDGVERIRAACDARWTPLNGTHLKVIPRVYLKIDKTDEQGVFPADLTPMDWESPAFTNRLVRFIEKLSLQSRDGDSRLVIRGNSRYRRSSVRYTRNVTTDGRWTLVLQNAEWRVGQVSTTVEPRWNGAFRREGPLSAVVFDAGLTHILGPDGTILYPKGFVFILGGLL